VFKGLVTAEPVPAGPAEDEEEASAEG
jgi:hypothetical protein